MNSLETMGLISEFTCDYETFVCRQAHRMVDKCGG